MTLKERADEMIAIRERLLSVAVDDLRSNIQFVTAMLCGIHMLEGIEALSEELGVELKEDPFSGGPPYKKRLSFTYRGVEFFELKKEGGKGTNAGVNQI